MRNWSPDTLRNRRGVTAVRPPLRRLFVDVSTIIRADAGTGIQRVVRSVCNELNGTAWSEVEVHPVAAKRWRSYSVVECDLLPSRGRPPAGRLQLNDDDAFLGLDLSAHLIPSRRRQIARWAKNGAQVGFVIYDLLPYQQPAWFSPRTAPQFRRWLDTIAATATHVFPISKTVSAHFSAFVAADHDSRVSAIEQKVIPLSGDIGKFDDSNAFIDHPVLAAMRERPALLMVGTVEPRKGHDIALRAHRWARASSTSAPLLVFAGKPGWHTDALQSEMRALTIRRDGAVWLDRVSDQLLDRLYRTCKGLIVPSLGEGYCLPVREAQAYAKPVLARDLPVLRELKFPAITYFSDDSEETLGQQMLAFAEAEAVESDSPDPYGWSDTVHTIMDALREGRKHPDSI